MVLLNDDNEGGDVATLTITIGLPGSGKSTWAEEQVLAAPAGALVRVNRDSLRTMLNADRPFKGKKTERPVEVARDMLISTFLEAGRDVICDDTNLNPAVREHLQKLAVDAGAEYKEWSFLHVPIETCIKRDLMRARSVGEGVIRRMYRDFLAPKPKPVEYREGLAEAIIVDVDGTIALMNGRSPYDWARVGEDLPNQRVIDLIKRELAAEPELKLVICSGRDGSCYQDTWEWIWAQGLRPDAFLMREPGDQRKDADIKEELYRSSIEPFFNIRYVLDDRNQVVEKWRELGLTVLQVADGAF